jgi:hypothetical protein
MLKLGGAMSDHKPTAVGDIITQLHTCCSSALKSSLDDRFLSSNGASYAFATDLDVWNNALIGRPEQVLYLTAANEYVLALLNNAQGQYRNAFKGLRLSLELLLQGIYLSANLVILNEWLTSNADTSWTAIVDPDKGVFAKRFIRAFFPPAEEHAGTFDSLARTLYREMSECTHGNVPNKIPLPKTVEFDEATFALWHKKADTLRFVATFALTSRYFKSLAHSARKTLNPLVVDRLGHLESIRLALEEERS